jgi:hypothetical protein
MSKYDKLFRDLGMFDENKDKKTNDILDNKSENDLSKEISKGNLFLTRLPKKQREIILNLLKEIHKVQKSKLSSTDKAAEIKKIMWTNQSPGAKLIIGGLIGTFGGLFVFGTGGIGIAGLGGAIGIWGGLAGTVGGVLVSSLIQNFENKK